METYFNLPDGCSRHSKCSTCPFPDCIAPQKDIIKGKSIEDRHNKIRRLHDAGVPVSVIMDRVGYKDTGTVYRIIKERR